MLETIDSNNDKLISKEEMLVFMKETINGFQYVKKQTALGIQVKLDDISESQWEDTLSDSASITTSASQSSN